MATFTAATVPIENAGAASPLLEAAQQIGMPAASDDQPARTSEPATGSYEQFMSTFGNPARWAGR